MSDYPEREVNMKTTVKECLQLDIFKDAKLEAGKSGLERKVRYASVLEPVEPEEIKELVHIQDRMFFTGFLGARDDYAKQCEIIKTLAEEGAAALVVLFVGKGVSKIDESVSDAAEKSGLPLISFDSSVDVVYSDIIDNIEQNFIYGDTYDNKLIANTIFHLLDFDKHPNFQSAIRKAAIINGFQMILFNEDFGEILVVETRYQVPLDEAIRLAKEKKINGGSSTFYTMLGVSGVLTYWGNVTIAGEKYIMLIVDNDDLYTSKEITKLAEIIELAMGMWNYTPERDMKSDFIKAICRGNASLAGSLAEEIGIEKNNLLSVFVASGLRNDACEKVINDTEKEGNIRVMKLNDDDESYGVIVDEIKDGEDHKVDCLNLFEKLKETEGVRIFHVTGFEGISGACDGYRMITESKEFVPIVFPFKRVFTKYELTLVCNCVNVYTQGGFVKKSYIELLEVFKHVGGNKGKQLLETLETFILDAGMNSSKTSEFMGIHPNTVQYRLKKTNELLGAEITGNRVIPGLTIALALKRIERNQ